MPLIILGGLVAVGLLGLYFYYASLQDQKYDESNQKDSSSRANPVDKKYKTKTEDNVIFLPNSKTKK